MSHASIEEKGADAESSATLDEKLSSAAVALAGADVILLVTGAGWSADSGLPVYADIASVPAYQSRGLAYADVSRPQMIEKDPALFYGFWGQALHDYRQTVPHAGYEIVRGWRRDKMNSKVAEVLRKKVKAKMEKNAPGTSVEPSLFGRDSQYVTPFAELPIEDMAGSFFCFTSNCDGHFYDFLPTVDIHDCHGNIELWQCSDRDCDSGIWRAPTSWSIAVDSKTLEAPPTGTSQINNDDGGDDDEEFSTPRLGHSQGIGARKEFLKYMPQSAKVVSWGDKHLSKGDDSRTNWPTCNECNALARPAIFMFGDFGWKYDHAQNARWNAWRESVVELCCDTSKSLKVCVLEVGCGKNVPTCRTVSEIMVEDLIKTGFGDDTCLVRINPDLPEADHDELAEYVISIPTKGMAALERINSMYAVHKI
jgi:NAD-dependent SIR2 family protein deacetylase